MSHDIDRDREPDAQCREALSRLIDGELDEAECQRLLTRLARDEAACREWALLNAASDALRSSEVAALHSTAFVARLRTALAAEPTLQVATLRPRTRRVVPRMALPAAAVAAAVGVLAVVALPLLRTPAPVAESGQMPAALSAAAVVAPAAAPGDAIVRAAELEAYLEAHREQASGPMLPRLTAYQRASATLAAPQR